jgi:hypothetical protein
VKADDVELAQRTFDSEGVLGDVGAECPVGAIDVVVGTVVGDDGKLDRGGGQGHDSAGGPDRFGARDVDGRFAAFVGEEVACEDPAGVV